MRLAILNARMLDMELGTENQVDLLIDQGRIVRISPAGTQARTEAHRVIQADGMYAFPGFVDFHTHLFRHGSSFGLDADRLLEAGVVCAADMGSAGWVNYPAMHRCDMADKRLELKAYLNLSPVGQPGRGITEPLNDAVIDVERMKDQMAAYPGEIMGIKIRISRGIVGELGIRPLERAVEVGEELGLPVCVHTTDPPVTTDRLIGLLRPGDIYSHTYQGKGYTILDEDGHVRQGVTEGQRRGVIMEVGNGRVNFNFPVALKALEEGLYPDIISSDATPTTFHKERSMWDLPFVASKFLSMGMPLRDVIRSITETPARVLGVEDRFGTLARGREANVALCRVEGHPVKFCDSDGNTFAGTKQIVPCVTIRRGEVLFEA